MTGVRKNKIWETWGGRPREHRSRNGNRAATSPGKAGGLQEPAEARKELSLESLDGAKSLPADALLSDFSLQELGENTLLFPAAQPAMLSYDSLRKPAEPGSSGPQPMWSPQVCAGPHPKRLPHHILRSKSGPLTCAMEPVTLNQMGRAEKPLVAYQLPHH